MCGRRIRPGAGGVGGQRSAGLLTASSFSRYVYIPAGGSQHGLLGALFSTAMTFAFVSFWHGGNDYLWCWATLNWLGVTVENGVQKLVQRPRVQHSLVSRSWLVRQGQPRWADWVWEGRRSSRLPATWAISARSAQHPVCSRSQDS